MFSSVVQSVNGSAPVVAESMNNGLNKRSKVCDAQGGKVNPNCTR